jgi:hypothetical protein
MSARSTQRPCIKVARVPYVHLDVVRLCFSWFRHWFFPAYRFVLQPNVAPPRGPSSSEDDDDESSSEGEEIYKKVGTFEHTTLSNQHATHSLRHVLCCTRRSAEHTIFSLISLPQPVKKASVASVFARAKTFMKEKKEIITKETERRLGTMKTTTKYSHRRSLLFRCVFVNACVSLSSILTPYFNLQTSTSCRKASKQAECQKANPGTGDQIHEAEE